MPTKASTSLFSVIIHNDHHIVSPKIVEKRVFRVDSQPDIWEDGGQGYPPTAPEVLPNISWVSILKLGSFWANHPYHNWIYTAITTKNYTKC